MPAGVERDAGEEGGGKRDGGSRLLQAPSYLIKSLWGEGKLESGGEGRDAEWKCEPREARGVGGWM